MKIEVPLTKIFEKYDYRVNPSTLTEPSGTRAVHKAWHLAVLGSVEPTGIRITGVRAASSLCDLTVLESVSMHRLYLEASGYPRYRDGFQGFYILMG